MKHLLLSMASMLLFLHASMAQTTTAATAATPQNSLAIGAPAKTVSTKQKALPAAPQMRNPYTAVNKPGCDGQDRKLVNGVCEIGQIIFSRSEWNDTTHEWKCYYYYRWSDNSTSAEYYFVNSAGCP
ncbi:hypothetical protein [uncultured Chitinophaga sp.]|jgi:hypothetical protein|uniref:hypothetical protein n=1 Tax=uncultured Chitinophaga sp. TaxID=339340 RepID=UPI00262A1FEA|nr:hypothetical protein [uncultured Chitinophaga sp.]